MADPTLPTPDALTNVFEVEVRDRAPYLTDWSEGSALDALAGGAAALGNEVSAVVVDRFKTVFLDTCVEDEIDAWAADHYGDAVPRKAASAAVGEITWQREGVSTDGAGTVTGDVSGDFIIPAGTTASGTVGGVTVEVASNDSAVIPDGEPNVTVTATATIAGRAGNVAIDVIDSTDFEGVTVTNASAFTGGDDEETDARYRARVKAYPQTLRRGTVEALREGALRVGGVTYATVSETFIDPADGGYVAVYIGDPDAQASAPLVAAVELELVDWRAAGVRVIVTASVREEVGMVLRLTVRAGADQAAIRAAVQQAVLAYTNELDPNVPLYTAQIIAAAVSAHVDVRDADLYDEDGTTIATDLTPSEEHYALRVPETRLSMSIAEAGS